MLAHYSKNLSYQLISIKIFDYKDEGLDEDGAEEKDCKNDETSK